ncbi:hypothetical protein SELMODRAFT_145920 [Selaginella moellendorffii]|uniref:Protein kinase domain-containing protein n=1 Tax=Selaginella moellendorffii TaxID=88036 RepID=D8RCG7_SELML|nr:cold-responsive protein kinase 1 [Selaginella moellendorffii]EFJ30128.1 hypothetical protein SELMODRAFT_145920 [Selaginella moellendorffii]|eukprot:XP_002969012.1 cold-responsive protein kinase 1 [Selaginella moellendorffii]
MALLSLLWMIPLFLLDRSAAQGIPPDEPSSDARPGVAYYNTRKTTQGSQFQKNVETVIQFLYEHNPPNGFASCLGYGDFPDTAYGHTGCYNMSDQTSCASCIQQTYSEFQQLAPLAVGGVLWTNDTSNRCRIRFENYNFTPELVNMSVLGVLGPNVSAPAPAPIPPLSSSPPARASSSSSRDNRALVWRWGLVGGAVGLCLLLGVAGFAIWRWRMHTKLVGRHRRGDDTDIQRSIEGPVVFTYQDLSLATDSFSERNKLGQGGFGTVYKATLNNGSQVAVKKLSLQSNQGKREFVNEITIITGIQHRNLVRLKGYCVEADERLLVYEFLNKGSLDRALFSSGSNAFLDWQSRFQIAIGIARGLGYLHEESHVQVIHRDIKASNILLDDKLQPKISDFGISKLFDLDKGFGVTSTKVAGTLGYMAPEYATRGRLTAKADVFSYGILVLEIASGRKCVDPALPAEEELLLQLSWKLVMANRMSECIDKRLGGDYAVEEVSRLLRVAMLCTQEHEEARPTMSDVVAMLLGSHSSSLSLWPGNELLNEYK